MELPWKGVLMALVCLFTSVKCVNDIYFAEKLVEIYGTDGSLSVEQLQRLLDKLKTLNSPEKTEEIHVIKDSTLLKNDSCQNLTSSEQCLSTGVRGQNLL